MELRQYQKDAIHAILDKWKFEKNVLLQAATGAGKTIIFSALIKYCMERYNMKIVVLAHREQLVRQARDKLIAFWAVGKDYIGIACTSVSKVIDLSKPVIIGSPQTLIRRVENMPPVDLIIIDECHRLPPPNVDSQYKKLIDKLRLKNIDLRLLGVTATPYRLGQGYIYER